MLKIKIPFGFKMIQLDNLLTIYTGKIRIKADANDLLNALQNHAEHLTFTEGKNNCTTITFCTTNFLLRTQLINAINQILANIMHARIDRKYNNSTIFTDEMIDDCLPF
jgi:hypothetical protein